jgi:hypothetical protein
VCTKVCEFCASSRALEPGVRISTGVICCTRFQAFVSGVTFLLRSIPHFKLHRSIPILRYRVHEPRAQSCGREGSWSAWLMAKGTRCIALFVLLGVAARAVSSITDGELSQTCPDDVTLLSLWFFLVSSVSVFTLHIDMCVLLFYRASCQNFEYYCYSSSFFTT